MSKFVAVYLAPVEEMQKMMKNSSKEDMQKGMEEWNKWMGEHKEELVDPGAPLGKNKRVTPKGVTDESDEITGFSVVEAASHDEAAKLFQDNPHLQIKGAYIDVLKWVEMDEM